MADNLRKRVSRPGFPAYFRARFFVRLEEGKTRPVNNPSDLVFYWWALQDSNLRPADYESAALPTELRALFRSSHKNYSTKQGCVAA